MPSAQRRALLFFGWSVLLSMTLAGIDIAGTHSVVLRVAAIFSLLMGVVVLALRGRGP